MARLDEAKTWTRRAKTATDTSLDAIGRQSSVASFLNGENRKRKLSRRRKAAAPKTTMLGASADRLGDADQLLRRDVENPEHQVEESLLVSSHPDRAAAVRVLEHPEHALHTNADAVSDRHCGDDVDEFRDDTSP